VNCRKFLAENFVVERNLGVICHGLCEKAYICRLSSVWNSPRHELLLIALLLIDGRRCLETPHRPQILVFPTVPLYRDTSQGKVTVSYSTSWSKVVFSNTLLLSFAFKLVLGFLSLL